MTTGALQQLFAVWCDTQAIKATGGSVDILTEKSDGRKRASTRLVRSLREQYDDPKRVAARIKRMGYEKAAANLALRMPSSKKARSGDLGEILAANITQARLNFLVPVARLRWKDGRNTALRGDDVIGIRADGNVLVALLKGESKSRKALAVAAINDACKALKRDDGKPSPHSLVYLADRLHDIGKNDLAELLEDYQAVSPRNVPLHHLVFTVSGNVPKKLFQAALGEPYDRNIFRVMIGIVIEDHQDFIADLFKAAGA
jgi:hypothetical protein